MLLRLLPPAERQLGLCAGRWGHPGHVGITCTRDLHASSEDVGGSVVIVRPGCLWECTSEREALEWPISRRALHRLRTRSASFLKVGSASAKTARANRVCGPTARCDLIYVQMSLMHSPPGISRYAPSSHQQHLRWNEQMRVNMLSRFVGCLLYTSPSPRDRG